MLRGLRFPEGYEPYVVPLELRCIFPGLHPKEKRRRRRREKNGRDTLEDLYLSFHNTPLRGEVRGVEGGARQLDTLTVWL